MQVADIALVINPSSGPDQKVGANVLDPLMGAGLHLELVVPDSADQLSEFVSSQAHRFSRIIVAGGDGTLNLVCQSVPNNTNLDVAVLPLGSGNDFSRSLGFEPWSLDTFGQHACHSAAHPTDRVRYDLGAASSHFINVANGGLGGRIATFVEPAIKDSMGPAAYWLASASALSNLTHHQVVLELDGAAREDEVIGLAIANGRFVGGGFEIAPAASVDDGLLDIVLIPSLSALEVMSAGARYLVERDPERAPAQVLRAARVEVRADPPMPFSIDGELCEVGEATFEVDPGALNIVRNTSRRAT